MKRYYPLFLLSVLFGLFSSLSFAQETNVLPANLTEGERSIISEYNFTGNRFTPPPTGPVRAAAEWEEVEYLLITWQPNFPNILRQIVEAAIEECKVIITTEDETSVANYLQSNGVDLTNVIFMDEPFNSIWIRDYAGNTIYSDDVGERALTDWIYNRPRPLDNIMPSAHAALVGMPIYITDTAPNDLVNTGGNYMSDGHGNAFASELVLNENAAGNPYGVTAKTEAQIDGIMQQYMGIDTYIKMTPLPFDVINHIDMHMKLLDEETLLVSKYPEGVADGPQIEQNIDYVLANFQSAFGTPFRVKRIDAPPSSGGAYPDTGGYYRNYTNAIFINKTILIPLYRPEVDGPALAQWQEMMPGYNIVGIDVDNPGENLIALVGAIHCITHTIGVADPLWIVHQPVYQANINTNVTLDATVKHISGVSDVDVFWREVGSANWIETAMTNVSGDNWTTDLSIGNDDVEYYIEAEANSGKVLARPIVAPDGYWTINTEILATTDLAANNISAPFPNPTDGSVSFTLNNLTGLINVTVHNIMGQELMREELQNGNGTFTLGLNPQWKGTLFVTFEGDFGRATKKVIKI
ncbi:agmatine deiminase family protein [Aureitalea sp. L0-47]|uniref:agmatine deiminase family protein n=1 Tax=Aureitalea sp. L0-47 TaxID=2816962 RepID=UPI002237BC39|nr:agmatine deiminase family protein [Aureitalea sp. L0-47]MCW5518418.1 agmatine deiminase family protein [Aureitalea sp. L0-47]